MVEEMTFEEYEEKHLHDLNHEARRLVRMGWNARGKHGTSTMPAGITPEMIEAGAQRLVAWEENSEWPDSWSQMAIAAARNDAERVILSALSAAPADHFRDTTEMVQGNVQAMGDLNFNDEDNYRNALVIEFSSREEFAAAVESGQCRFTVFGGEL